jgi:amino acid adenylation domain-containing protein
MKTLDTLLFELSQKDVHLWLEGDRLRYRAAKEAVTPELLAEVKNRKAEIVKFLREVTDNRSSQIPPIVKIDRSGSLPLSFGQQRLWYLHRFEPDSSSNNVPVVVRFNGILNVPVLEQSLQALVRRHEVLRTRFPAVNDQPTQVIASEVNLTLPVIDLRDLPEDRRDAEALRLATEEAHRPFDLTKGPILRVLLLKLSDVEHLLVWNMHCIICDGASSDVFYQDLTALYTAFIAGKPSPLKDLPIQYVDFAHWQRQWLQGEVLESQLNYWKQKLEGSPSVIQLPTDYPRPPIVQTYRGDRRARMLPKALNNSLNNLSQKLGGTLFMTLIAAFETLLYRYSQQNDILISFASAGRAEVENEGVIGFFSNTLIQRINFDGNPTFQELFNRVREASLEANAHQDLPFEKQVKFALNPPWSNGRGMASVQLPDLTITSLFGYIYHGKTKYDLILVTREQDEGLGMVFDYNADLFEAVTIKRMLGHLETLLEGIVSNPDRRISELPLLTDLEQKQVLQEWHRNRIPLPETCIHEWFEIQAEKLPNKIAIVFKDEELSYREVNNRANQLAHYLQKLGVKTETLVGVCLERSPEAIVALLAILKVGGAYVPLNPSDCQDRQNLILQETQMPVVLTQGLIANTLNGSLTKLVRLDAYRETIQQQSQENLAEIVMTEALAAVLYPENKTEQLKGIGLTHKGIVQLAKNTDCAELNTTDIVLQLASLSSDTAMFEIWGSLLNGGKLIISPTYSQSPTFLGQIIRQYQATTLSLPTRLFHRMVDEHLESMQSVQQLFVGGDWLSHAHAQTFTKFLPDSLLFNVYSVAENTGFTCIDKVSIAQSSRTKIQIGRAITNTQTYVLDRNRQPVPIGIVGELYIGGDRLARGYYERPDLTHDSFIENPFSQEPNVRLYKTGNLVRYQPDGNLEFVSTINELATIQGLQVEHGRIEAALSTHPSVKESCVLTQRDATDAETLVAYIVLHPGQTETSNELRQFLNHKLSAHMIPSIYIFLDALPLTANSKVDRSSLSTSDLTQKLSEEFVAPRNEMERQLANIWGKLLGNFSISIHDNFFSLGGNSLLSIRLVSEMEKTFNYCFPLSSVFQISTIAELAQWMHEKPSETTSDHDRPPSLSLEDYRALLSHSAGKTGLHLGKRGLVINILPEIQAISQPFIWIGRVAVAQRLKLKQPIYVMPGASLSPSMNSHKDYISIIASLLVDELMTIQPSESYSLGGWCYDGLVAMEMAQQLQKRGKNVDLLALVDAGGRSKIYKLSHHLNFYIGKLKFYLFKLSKLSLQEKWQFFNKKINRKTTHPKEVTEVNKKSEIEQAVNLLAKAAKEYTPNKYIGKVLLVIGIEQIIYGQKEIKYPDLSWLFPFNGWGKLLQGKVCISKLQCDHLDLVEDPYCNEVGNAIQQILSSYD